MGIPVNRRLELLLDHLKITQKQLGEIASLSENTISNAKKGKNIPGVDFFNALYKSIPNLNPAWLYMGEGEMFLDGENLPVKSNSIPNENSEEHNLSLEDCKKMAILLETEIQYLKIQLKDKEEIITLLKSKISKGGN